MNITEGHLEYLYAKIKPIGIFHTDAKKIPRHWTLSNTEGILTIDREYTPGLRDVKAGQRIVVIFLFHKSSDFTSDFLFQTPPHNEKELGVFSICSPVRPNPIGMSVLEVLERKDCNIKVKGIDMLDGTPLLDIKPYVESKHDCPRFKGQS